MVLIELKPKADYTDRILNPSPCGDYGSYELAYEESSVDAARNPSPCGDYGSYQIMYLWNDYAYDCESVPLRGLWFLSAK